jgi:hypothetical protein
LDNSHEEDDNSQEVDKEDDNSQGGG